MLRAVLLLLALALGAAWPSTGRHSIAASGTFAGLASGDVPSLPAGVRSHPVPGSAETGGPDGRSGPTPRRPGDARNPEPELVPGPRDLSVRVAAARATDHVFLSHAARLALTRAGLTSSPHTAPPDRRLA